VILHSVELFSNHGKNWNLNSVKLTSNCIDEHDR